MALSRQTKARIDELCWAQQAGQISSQQQAELDRLVATEPEACETYVRYVALCASLEWQFAEHPKPESLEEPNDRSVSRSPVLGFLGGCVRSVGETLTQPTPFSLAAAAMVIGAILIALGMVYLPNKNDPLADRHPDVADPVEPAIVAKISGTAHATWQRHAVVHLPGDSLKPGSRLRLAGGLVQLTFNSGATAILRGPAEFLLRSEMGGFLLHGTLTAMVSEGGKGFTVGTAAATIVDLGTEFGVVVDPRQTSTVTVFQGRVSVTQSSQQSNMKRELVAGQSMRFNIMGEALAVRAVDHEKQFVRVMPAPSYRQTVLAEGPRWYWSFDESSGPAIQWARKRMQGNLAPVGPVRRTTHESLSSGLRLGRAADFSGGGCFAGDLDSDAVSGAWALETWLQVEQSTPGFTKQYIIHTDPKTPRSSNPALIFDFDDGDGVDNELELFSKYNDSRGEVKRTAGGPQLSDGRWHHFVFVFYGDGSRGVADRTEVYIDGTRHQGLSRRGFSADLRIGTLLVGAARLSGEQGFKGRLDELAIYDLSSMTALEIEKRMPAMARRHITAARRVNGKALAEPVAPTISTELK